MLVSRALTISLDVATYNVNSIRIESNRAVSRVAQAAIGSPYLYRVGRLVGVAVRIGWYPLNTEVAMIKYDPCHESRVVGQHSDSPTSSTNPYHAP